MSSPLDRDFCLDEPSPYAPKWVRDAAYGGRGKTDERKGMMQKSAPDLNGARPSTTDSAASNEPVVADRYRLPPSLEPTLIPEPWPVPRSRSALGLLVRFVVAAAIAAVVALFVFGKFPPTWLAGGQALEQDSPSFGSRFSGQNAQTSEQPKPATAQLNLNQEGARAAADAVPHSVTLTRTVEGATAPNPQAGLAAQPQASTAAQSPVSLVPQPPAAVAAQPPASPAKSFPIRQLERDEIADLIRRGEAFIASGDFASARLVLQRAAEASDPRAALTLAGTYDPIVLEKLGIQGLASDIALARSWYERAKELGSPEALQRLEMLASRDR
jgi:hypothetical protein